MRDITAAQLDILASVYGEDAVPAIPKMWAMYKEVADYYEQGVGFDVDTQRYPVNRPAQSARR
jgi:hypothetical protein